MSKRHTLHSVLHLAVAACAVVSVGLASVSTAQLIRNRRAMHRSAPTNTVSQDQQEMNRTEAAAVERAQREQTRTGLRLRNMRLGN